MLSCGCASLGYREGMHYDEIVATLRLNKTCTSPRWLCSNVDGLLRLARLEKDRKNAYEKRRTESGRVAEKSSKTRGPIKAEEVNIDDLL